MQSVGPALFPQTPVAGRTMLCASSSLPVCTEEGGHLCSPPLRSSYVICLEFFCMGGLSLFPHLKCIQQFILITVDLWIFILHFNLKSNTTLPILLFKLCQVRPLGSRASLAQPVNVLGGVCVLLPVRAGVWSLPLFPP